MARPCGNCCSPDPGNECSSQDALPHPSAGRTYVLTTTGTLTTDTIQRQCSSTLMSLADSAKRRHLLDVEVDATAHDLWSLLQVVWFDVPRDLDTSVIGSVTAVVGGFTFKPSLLEPIVKPNDEVGPWFVRGIVVVQGGTSYYALFHTPLYPLAGSCCWTDLRAGPVDQDCSTATIGLILRLGLHRPLPENQTSDTETVLSGTDRLCSDWFGVLNDDGSIDLTQRPNLDLSHDANVIEKIGYVWGLSTCPPFADQAEWGARGTWRLAGLTGPICGTLATASFPYTAGPDDAPQPPGTLVINESFASGLPSDWIDSSTTALPGVYLDDDASKPLFGGPSQVFTGRDGMLVAEESARVDNEYNAGTAYLEIPIDSGPQSPDFVLTVEVVWRRVNEQDRRYLTADGWHPADIRSQECGIFAAPFGKMILAHRIAQLGVNAPLTHRAVVELTYPVTEYGGPASGNYWLFPRTDYGWRCPCSLFPPEVDCENFSVGTQFTNPSLGRVASCLNASPEDGTRMTMRIKRLPAQVASDCNFDVSHPFASRAFQVDAWINGRKVIGFNTTHDWAWVWSDNIIRVGVVAHWGGAWSDFRAWLQR